MPHPRAATSPLALALALALLPGASAWSHSVWADSAYYSPGEVAGIVLGSIAALVLVLGLIFCLVWVRKRGVRERVMSRRRSRQLDAMAEAEGGAPAQGTMARTVPVVSITASEAASSLERVAAPLGQERHNSRMKSTVSKGVRGRRGVELGWEEG
jgi:hypothetical protein